MASNKQNVGRHTIFLPSKTAVALWRGEISGQISDGMWENSRPFDHWRFWCCSITVLPGDELAFVPTRDYTGTCCTKKSYALARLYQLKFYKDGEYVLRDRMLAMGRMAKACDDVTNTSLIKTAEYMPASFDEWKKNKASGEWKFDYAAHQMESVSHELAKKFYAATYTMKEMKSDIGLIKRAMKLAADSNL